MQALIDQLQAKIKSFKKQIEEAEEIAALNLAKYRAVSPPLTGPQTSMNRLSPGSGHVVAQSDPHSKLPKLALRMTNNSRISNASLNVSNPILRIQTCVVPHQEF